MNNNQSMTIQDIVNEIYRQERIKAKIQASRLTNIRAFAHNIEAIKTLVQVDMKDYANDLYKRNKELLDIITKQDQQIEEIDHKIATLKKELKEKR